MPGRIIPKGKTAKGPGINVAPGTTLSDEKIAEAAIAAGFPDKEIPTAVAVALAESGGKVDATNHNTNGSIDYGLWQINSVNLKTVGSSPAQLTQDPQINAKAAFVLWTNAHGWSPWVTFTTGKYLIYMGRGKKAAQDAHNSTIGNEAANTASSLLQPFKDLVDAISFLFSKQFLYLIFGAIVLLMALYLIVAHTGGGKKIAQAAAVIPK